jgi:hypothetical protein
VRPSHNQNFATSDKNKSPKIVKVVDIAARHLVAKLFEVTDGKQGAWQVLGEIGEGSATVARAVERGWMLIRDETASEGIVQTASLTSEGRVLARKMLA